MQAGPYSLVRFPGKTKHKPAGSGNSRLISKSHPAAILGRSRFTKGVRNPDGSEAVLKGGHHNAKIGKYVTKGKWKGFHIYTLSLEERATCPRTCLEWLTCYGNHMPFSHRFRHGPELEDRLEMELAILQHKHPNGFVVRLHVLGDFYSTEYVLKWKGWLRQFPALHVFGYTAWGVDTEIGQELWWTRRHHKFSRFALRWSNGDKIDGPVSRTIHRGLPLESGQDLKKDEIICPAQTGKSLCCGTCTLCWAAPAKTIVFERH